MLPRAKIIARDNALQVAVTAVDIFTTAAENAVRDRGRYMVALSGGSTPRGMHRMFADESYFSVIPWNKIHIFWVDERCVPVNSRSSNFGAAKRDFLLKVPIQADQIHAMPGHTRPEAGALGYQQELTEFFRLEQGRFPVFDIIFLGMGSDGHTASLFPGHKALDEKNRLIVAVKGGNPYVSRLTMTLPVINNARRVVFLVCGAEKADTLRVAFEDESAGLPVQQIRPRDGELMWLLDKEAASLLPGKRIHEGP